MVSCKTWNINVLTEACGSGIGKALNENFRTKILYSFIIAASAVTYSSVGFFMEDENNFA